MARIERKRTFSGGGQRPSNAMGVFIKMVGDDYDAQGKPTKPKGLLFRLEAPEDVSGSYVVVTPADSYVSNARTSPNFPRSAITPLGKDDPSFIPAMLVLKSDDRSKDLKMGDRASLSYYPGRNQDSVYHLSEADKQVRIVHPRTQEIKERPLDNAPDTAPVLQVVAYGFRLFSRAAYGAFDTVTGKRVVTQADKVFNGHGFFKVRYLDDRNQALYDIVLSSEEKPKSWEELHTSIMHGVSDDGDHYNNVFYVETPDNELFVYSVPRLTNEERKSVPREERAVVIHERVAKAMEEANGEFEQFKAKFPLESLNTWMVRSFCLGTSQNYGDWERKLVRNTNVPTNAVEREINFNAPYMQAMSKWKGNRGYIALERPAAWPTMSEEERTAWNNDARILPHEVVALKMAVSVTVKEDGKLGFARRFCLTGGDDLVRPYPCMNMTKEAAAAYTLEDYQEHLHPESQEGGYGQIAAEEGMPAHEQVSAEHNAYVQQPPQQHYQQEPMYYSHQPAAQQPHQQGMQTARYSDPGYAADGGARVASPANPGGSAYVQDIDDDIPF